MRNFDDSTINRLAIPAYGATSRAAGRVVELLTYGDRLDGKDVAVVEAVATVIEAVGGYDELADQLRATLIPETPGLGGGRRITLHDLRRAR